MDPSRVSWSLLVAIGCASAPVMKSDPSNAVGRTRRSIAAIERTEPDVNAIIAVNRAALDDARALDASDDPKGLLYGVPIVLKDNIETKEPIATTAGSLALAKHVTGRDAPLVANLRAEGALIIGKANLSEWANFRSTHSTSGWSAVGGLTRNPHDPRRSACGSSSGSAAAVAAGVVRMAVGTETDGSVVCPSGVNGIVGFKPTVGLVDGGGIVPISSRQDTAGAMAKTVDDATKLLAAMIERDANGRRGETRAALLAVLEEPPEIEGKRIGVVRSMAGYLPQVDALLDRALADMTSNGAVVIDDLTLEFPKEMKQYLDVLCFEFRRDLEAYLASTPGATEAKSLEALIAFNEAHADRELAHFDQDLFEKSLALEMTEDQHRELVQILTKAMGEDGIARLLEAHDLDVLVAPTGSPAWMIDLVLGDHFVGASSSPSAITGWPIISVPMGTVGHLPVGLSFFAGPYAEPTIAAVARAFEAR